MRARASSTMGAGTLHECARACMLYLHHQSTEACSFSGIQLGGCILQVGPPTWPSTVSMTLSPSTNSWSLSPSARLAPLTSSSCVEPRAVPMTMAQKNIFLRGTWRFWGDGNRKQNGMSGKSSVCAVQTHKYINTRASPFENTHAHMYTCAQNSTAQHNTHSHCHPPPF